MRRALLALTAALLLCAALAGPARAASFGLDELDLAFTDESGATQMQAGSHPFALTTSSAVVSEEGGGGNPVPVEQAKDVRVSFAAGLVPDLSAVPTCSAVQFLSKPPLCPDATVIGVVQVEYGLGEKPNFESIPLYNLSPSPGFPAKVGFLIENSLVPVSIDLGLSPDPPYNGIAYAENLSQGAFYLSSVIEVWGVPAAHAHDARRGHCLLTPAADSCPVSVPEAPFLTLPRSCEGPLPTTFEADSWQHPTVPYPFKETIFSHGESGEPLGSTGCSKLGFAPTIAAKPTTLAAQSPSGLDLSLEVSDPGLVNPEGIADSDIERAVIVLPEGMSANPSLAEGLATCSEAELARESATSAPGEGCPEASKIGSVEVETPLLEGRILKGALYVAKPYENPFDSLLALYMTVKDPGLGIGITLAGKVEPDPQSGQLIASFGDPSSADPAFRSLPQLPFSHFRTQLREGGRSPLISPPGCGPHTVTAELTPYSGGPPITTTSTFQIQTGPNGAPCPSGAAPFHPGFEAGTLSNQAGAYSPFYMRLTRSDGEQDMTRFSSVLPPGVVGKIAGLGQCPEAAIALAKSRSGPHGGAEELASPACPAASRIGRTSAGAGVGSQLTYVPGSLYLAGPYGGDPLSVVSITPALAGPFDAGTVVVREALTLNPLSAEVEVDGRASDPIPHILKGIPLNVRDLRVYADRPDFTLNATSCEEEQARATLWGGGTALNPSGEAPVGLAARYQAAGCASLGFEPKLAIELKGGTRRGKFPALKAVVTPRAGDANFAAAVVTLPHSAFLEQGHFGTICTRVQFAQGAGNGTQCPAASVYGRARAWSPLLAEPAAGPVYLRSSNHNLPDLVVALKGPPSAPFDVQLASRIDSHKGGIRSSFEAIPDIPVSRFILEMQGGRKGLIVNSTDICAGKHRAIAKLSGQNGRVERTHPLVRAVKCPKAKKSHRSAHHKRRA